jgi:RNA polymerase sigma factor (sigma-70 family)
MMNAADFQKFFENHWQPTFNYGLGLGCSWCEAEDITQEVLMEIWRHGQRCALQTMVRQRIIKLRRKKALSRDGPCDPSKAEDRYGEMEINDCLEAIRDPIDRSIVELRLQGSTNAEAARILGMTRAGIGKRLVKLRRRLVNWL